MSLAVFAVLCAVTVVMLMWKRPSTRRTQALLALVVGLALSGTAGAFRGKLDQLSQSASANATQKIFGVGVPYGIALAVVIWFVLDMDLDGLVNKLRKKKGAAKGAGAKNAHTTTAVTPWLALIVPVALAALPIVNTLPDALRSGLSSLTAGLGG